jgi:hypothetical protein
MNHKQRSIYGKYAHYIFFFFFFESIELELKRSYGGTIPEPPAMKKKMITNVTNVA